MATDVNADCIWNQNPLLHEFSKTVVIGVFVDASER